MMDGAARRTGAAACRPIFLQLTRTVSAEQAANQEQHIMANKFRGGPLDGLQVGSDKINAVARIVSMTTKTRRRQFLFMPLFEDCEAIWAGQKTKDQARQTSLTARIYERQFTEHGVEYVHRYDPLGIMRPKG
jgi:hypothetical protein